SEARRDHELVCIHAGSIHRVRGDPPRLALAAHAADVVDQRAGCDRRRGRDHPGRRGEEHAGDDPGHGRDRGRDEQRRRRVPDLRPDAQDVQGERPEGDSTAMIGSEHGIEIAYLIATALFILSLKWMSSPTTAQRGVRAGELGMFLAIVGTLLHHRIVDYTWIAVALVLGSIIGVPLGLVQMTAVPQRTALSHAFGALCVTLVGTAEFSLQAPKVPPFLMTVLAIEGILGSLTFTGSLMAAGKLPEILPQQPITYRGQNFVYLSLLGLALVMAAYLVFDPRQMWLFPAIVVIALAFGVLMIIPIGGADMPTVISLLNSYAGLSAAAMGFVLDNKL